MGGALLPGGLRNAQAFHHPVFCKSGRSRLPSGRRAICLSFDVNEGEGLVRQSLASSLPFFFATRCCRGAFATTPAARSKRPNAAVNLKFFVGTDFAMTFFSDGTRAKLHSAVGEAMEAYANYEANAASLIRVLLKADYRQSMAIYFAVKSSRDRMELFENLIMLRLSEKHRPMFRPFWNSVTAYLQVMTRFRNALAHWHPYVSIYEDTQRSNAEASYLYRPTLANPAAAPGGRSLQAEDIAPFIQDCRFASGIFTSLYDYFEKKPRSLPERFRRPITRQNLADLQPPPTAKARQPRRPLSTPKLSRAQKRAKALKDVRGRANG